MTKVGRKASYKTEITVTCIKEEDKMHLKSGGGMSNYFSIKYKPLRGNAEKGKYEWEAPISYRTVKREANASKTLANAIRMR